MSKPREDFTDFLGDPLTPAQHASRLATEFFYPPFSVLNARDGWWQERKREWLALGIQSELGRGELANDRGASATARTNDAAEMQRSKKANAIPGGSKWPTINPKTGKICRSDSKGRPIEGTDAGQEKPIQEKKSSVPATKPTDGLAAIRQALK